MQTALWHNIATHSVTCITLSVPAEMYVVFKFSNTSTLHYFEMYLFSSSSRDALQRQEEMRLIRSATENLAEGKLRVWHFLRTGGHVSFPKETHRWGEKKSHGRSVDITFVAHGAIRDSVIPACYLLPLPTIADLLLYSPWNCVMNVDAVFGVATGLMKPQHHVFKTRDGAQISEGELDQLPNSWNSMKKAGAQMIPNIVLSPLKSKQDGIWRSFEVLAKKYSGPERNCIVIPFILPAGSDSFQSVPLFLVMLALSLVLMSSRFHSTVHLTACLGDQSVSHKFDKKYLKTQYACTADNTVMSSSPDMFPGSCFNGWRRFWGLWGEHGEKVPRFTSCPAWITGKFQSDSLGVSSFLP